MGTSATSDKPSVCLVSSHSIVLSEIKRALAASGLNLQTVKLSSGSSLPSSDIYVIDGDSIPEGPILVVKNIVSHNPDAQMLVIVEKATEQLAFPLLSLGVKGLVTQDLLFQQLSRALEAVSSGGFWVPRVLLASFVNSVTSKSRQAEARSSQRVGVSRREQEIMDGLLQNLSNKEIAVRLNISERTVKFHVSNLLRKFNVQRRADLILLWYQRDTLSRHSSLPQ